MCAHMYVRVCVCLYVYVYTHHIFIHLSVDGYLGCFRILVAFQIIVPVSFR